MAQTFHYFHPSDNVAPNATVTTGGTENTSYPLANAVDISYRNLANPSKLTDLAGDWICDFGSAQRMDAVVIWHNFDEDLPVRFEANASNSWSAPTLASPTILAPAKRADGHTVKIYFDLRDATGYSASGFRYGRLVVGDAPLGPDIMNSVPVGIKILIFSRVRQLERDFQWGVVDDENRAVIDMTTDAVYPWAYDLGAAPRLLQGGKLDTDADAEAIREWFRACAGPVNPTVIVPEPDGAAEPWLVRWASGPVSVRDAALRIASTSNQRAFADVNQRQLAFEEIVSGDPEWT